MKENKYITQLFRTEYRKITSVLCKLFGIEHIEIAEDIVSDTFLKATETWSINGVPENPTAWLYTVSKNKILNVLKHDKILSDKIALEIKRNQSKIEETDIDLSNENIIDSQLQMMFATCHPSISTEAQIGLCLNILCGFGVDEIADAFLTNKETVYKRLARAKEKLKAEGFKIELPPPSEIDKRLETVLTTLYLLFSEGYYSTSQNTTIRKELCLEAIRLTLMLLDKPQTNTPSTNALTALMCFHSSRFEARLNKEGNFILYDNQDETLWNQELIDKGNYYLAQASSGTRLTKYHLEAAIAYWNTQKKHTNEKWENILQLYNDLLQIEYSPMAALNRTYALAKSNGVQEAIQEAEKLNLTDSHFYYVLLGELYRTIDSEKSKANFTLALSLTKTITEKEEIQKKINQLAS